MKKNSILEVSHLSKSYDGKKLALSDCSFSIETGKICAVVGESGSGKTTLLRLIAGLERPDNGVIKINGMVASDDNHILAPQKRQLGLVFQDYALFPHLTVEQNISYGLKSNQQERVRELLQLIKMEGYEKSYPGELSGGQQQRVALARTLALKPDLLLMDEPFSNLDAGLKSALRREIKNIVNTLATSMLFITHDLLDAIDIADEIIFLKDGQLLKNCSIQDFAKNNDNESIQAMLADLQYNAEKLLNFL